MAALAEALGHAVDTLTAAGVAASTDPRDLNLPAVWVTISELPPRRLSGTAGEVRVGLTAIVADAGFPGTLDELDALVDAVEAVFPTAGWDPQAVVLPSMGKTPMPALATTIILDWSTTP